MRGRAVRRVDEMAAREVERDAAEEDAGKYRQRDLQGEGCAPGRLKA